MLLAAVDQPAVNRLARYLTDWLGGADPRLQRTAAQVRDYMDTGGVRWQLNQVGSQGRLQGIAAVSVGGSQCVPVETSTPHRAYTHSLRLTVRSMDVPLAASGAVRHVTQCGHPITLPCHCNYCSLNHAD